MSIRAKFECHSVVEDDSGTCTTVTMHAVYGDGSDNAAWSAATPWGILVMGITNPNAVAAFQVGQAYYLDISPVEAAPAALAPVSEIAVDPAPAAPIDTTAPDPAAPPAPAADPAPPRSLPHPEIQEPTQAPWAAERLSDAESARLWNEAGLSIRGGGMPEFGPYTIWSEPWLYDLASRRGERFD